MESRSKLETYLSYESMPDVLLKNHAQVTNDTISLALENADEKIIKRMISFAADMTFTDTRHNNLLHLAIKFHCDINVIQGLINKGCDVNAVNDEGETPFVLAEQSGYSQASELLLSIQLSKDLKSEPIKKPEVSEFLPEIEIIHGKSEEEISDDESEYESENELFTVGAIEARLKKLQPNDLENIEIPAASYLPLWDSVREQYEKTQAKDEKADINAAEEFSKEEFKAVNEIAESILNRPQIKLRGGNDNDDNNDIVKEPIDIPEVNSQFDPIEPVNEHSLELELSEDLSENLLADSPENKTQTVIENEDSEFSQEFIFASASALSQEEEVKNAIAKETAEKCAAIAKMCFRDKKNQDFFIDRLETILQTADKEQDVTSICEKTYASTAKYLIYQTANELPDQVQEDFIKLAKRLSARYITRKPEQIKGSFEQEVLVRAEAKLLKQEKARLIRVLKNEYNRIQDDPFKFMNDKLKTQNKLNVIQRYINQLSEAGSLNTFSKLEQFTNSLLINKNFSQSRNRFFMIESDIKKNFEEKFGKSATQYKKNR